MPILFPVEGAKNTGFQAVQNANGKALFHANCGKRARFGKSRKQPKSLSGNQLKTFSPGGMPAATDSSNKSPMKIAYLLIAGSLFLIGACVNVRHADEPVSTRTTTTSVNPPLAPGVSVTTGTTTAY